MSREVRHLRLEQLMVIAKHAVAGPVLVRDVGLLEAAVSRPAASVFGEPAYASIWEMAAALLHSVVCNHGLVDGNKRLGWLAAWTFLAKNDLIIDVDDDTAYDLVIDVASGAVRDVAEIAQRLRDMPRSAAS